MILTLRNILLMVLNLVFGVLAFFLIFRIIFQLVVANSQTPFLAWLFNFGERFIFPFAGIVPNLAIGGSGALDIVALIALLAYGILIYFIMALIDMFIRPYITTHHEHIV